MAILPTLISRLRALPVAALEEVAREAGIAKTFPRKLAYGQRPNPTINNIQPLLDYFDEVDRGERQLPSGRRKALEVSGA